MALRIMKEVGDTLVFGVVRLFFRIIGWLPRPLAHRICRALASLIFFLDAKHRRIGHINLKIAFPDSTRPWRDRVLRGSFQRLGDLAVEIAKLHRLDHESVEQRVRYEQGRGVDNYWAARRITEKTGRGILFVTAHISAWEILPLSHALLTNPLNFLVRPLDNRMVEKWIDGLRTRFGNRTMPKSRAIRWVVRAINKGQDVGFLIDQNVQERDGVYAPLFGRPASTSSAVAALAMRLKLPVVVGFIYPVKDWGHYTIRFYPPLIFEGDHRLEEDLVKATTELNRLIEEVIREFPDCWLWGHRRFSTQPGREDLYGR